MAKQLNVALNFTAETGQAKAAIQDLQASLSKIAYAGTGNIVGNSAQQIKEASEAAKQLQYHLNNAYNATTGNFDLSRLDRSLQASKTNIADLSAKLLGAGAAGQQAFAQLAQSISMADQPMFRVNAKLTEMLTTLKNTARWQISSSILHGFMGTIQHAYGYAQDLNESLNNIRIVTGQSVDQMAKFAEQANKSAKALSTTTTEYTNASLIYYQQGLTDAEVQERTDVTIKMANAAGVSAQTVSDQMTAVWNNFDDGSKSLEYYADVMTALGAATASSTDEIAAGLEKFAAVSETVGLSYEYATAALATVTATTRQSADVVGNAFKTLFARIQGLNLGETLEDGTTLNKYSQALEKVGISIFEQNGQMKEMDKILDEMGAKWDTLDKAQQTALAQTVAGVRQYTQLVALMDKWDYFKENLDIAYGAEGELDKQADIYAESWEAARDRVKAASEDIYNDLLDDKFFITINNGFANLLTGIGEFIEGIGGAKGVIAAFGSIFLTNFANKMPEAVQNLKYNIDLLTKGSQVAYDTIQKQFKQATEQAFSGGVAQAGGIDRKSSLGVQIETSNSLFEARNRLAQVTDKLSSSEKQLYETELNMIQTQQREAIEKTKKAETLKNENDKIIQESLGYSDTRFRDIASTRDSSGNYFINDADFQSLEKLPEKGFEIGQQISAKLAEGIIAGGRGQLDLSGYFSSFTAELEKISVNSNNLEEVKVKIKAITAALPEGTAEALKFDQSLEQIDSSDSDVVEKALDDIIEKLKNAKIESGQAKEFLDRLLGETDANKLIKGVRSYSQAAKEATGAQSALNRMVAAFQPTHVVGGLEAITAAAAGLGNLATGLNSIKSAFQALSNPDLSGFEKFTTILTSVSMVIPMSIYLMKNWATTIAGLNIVTASLGAITAGATAAQKAEAAATLMSARVHDTLSKILTKEQMQKALVVAITAKEAGETKEAVAAKVLEYLTTNKIVSGKKAEIISRYLAKAAIDLETASVWGLVKALLAAAAAWIATPMGAIIAAISVAVLALGAALIYQSKAQERANAAIDEANQKYDEENQKLQDLESQLKSVQDRIKELQALGTLSITEQEELNNLKEQEASLQRQIAMQEELAKAAQRNQANEIAKNWGKSQKLTEEKEVLKGFGSTKTGPISLDEYKKLVKFEDTEDWAKTHADKYQKILEWQKEIDDNHAKWLEENGKQIQANEDNYSSYMDAIKAGTVERDDEKIAEMQGDLKDQRQKIYGDNYEEKILAPLIENISGSLSKTDLQGNVNWSDRILQSHLDSAGVLDEDFNTYVNEKLKHIQDNTLITNEELLSLDFSQLMVLFEHLDALEGYDGTGILNFIEGLQNSEDQVSENQQKLDAVKSAQESLKEKDMTLGDWTNIRDNTIEWGKEGVIEFSKFLEMSYEEQSAYLEKIKALQEGLLVSEKENELNALKAELIALEDKHSGVSVSPEEKQAMVERKAALEEELLILKDIERAKEIEDLGLDAEEVDNVSDALLEMSESGAKGYEILKDDAEALHDAAVRTVRVNEAVVDLSENYDSYAEVLEDVKKSTNAVDKAMAMNTDSGKDLKKSLANLLDTSEDLIDANLLDAIDPKDFKKAAEGDEEAIERIRDSFERLQAEANGISFEDLNNELENLETGAIIDLDNTPFLQKLIEARVAAGDGAAEIESLLSGLNIDADVTDFVGSMNDMIAASAEAGSAVVANTSFSQDIEQVQADATKTNEEVEYQTSYTATPYSVTSYVLKNGADAPTPVTETRYNFVKSVNPMVNSTDTTETTIGTAVNTTNAAGKSGQVKGVKIKNAHKSSGGGVSPSSKPSGGSGGGSGGSSPKYAEKKNDSDKTRYHTLQNQLEDLSAEYDKIADASDRAFGEDKLKKIDDEIVKTDELIKKQEEYIDAISTNLPIDKSIMEAYYNDVIGGPAIQFDENGNIANYDAIQDAMYAKYNAMTAYDEESEEWKVFEEKYEQLEKYIEQYEETYDLLRDEEAAYQELLNQRLDLMLEQVQYEVELKLNVSDDSLKLIEFQLNMLEDNAFKAAEAIEFQAEQAEILYDKMQTSEQGLRDILATSDMSVNEIEQLLAGNAGVLQGHTFTEAQIEAIKEYRDNLLDLAEEMQEVREEVQERLIDAFDQWNEELDEGIEKFDHYNSLMENYKNIIDIVGKDYLKVNNSMLGDLSQAMVENNINRVYATRDALKALTETEIQARQAYEEALARGNENDILYWEETLKVIGDEVSDAQEEMMQAWEDALQSAAEAFEAAVEAAIENFEKALLPFGTLEEFSNAYEKQQELADQYLDDYKQIYELSKLNRDIANSMDDTKSIAGKQKLKGLMDDINKLQEEGTQLSEYDLEYLQKTYDLRMAEIALEEAQKAKDTVRLTRDNEGNWSYAYTTNTDAADDAAQKYEDALYAMQELSSEYIDEMSEQLISTSQEMEEALAAVRVEDYASIEEYYKKLDEIQQYYLDRMTFMQGEMQKALDNNKALYEQDWQNYSNATGYKISDDEKFAMSYKDTVLGTLFGSESDIVDFQQRVNEALGTSDSGLIGELLDAYLQWSENTDNAMIAAGTSSEGFADDMDQAVHGDGGIVDSSTAATDAVNDMANQMVAGFDTITNAVVRWQSQVGDAADAVINDYLDTVEAFNLMVATLSSTKGNDIAENDLTDIVTSRIKSTLDVASMDTGGYTGVWGPEGKFLLAHEKELILNSEDTKNLLSAVHLTREMLNTIDINARQASIGFGTLSAGFIKEENNSTLEQQVHITAEFPNVTDHYEVEEALNNLINTSSQYANRK